MGEGIEERFGIARDLRADLLVARIERTTSVIPVDRGSMSDHGIHSIGGSQPVLRPTRRVRLSDGNRHELEVQPR